MVRRARQAFASGPFRGMRANWRGAVDEALAYEVGNMLPLNRTLGASPLVMVPPSTVLTGLSASAPASDNFTASNLLDALNETVEAVLDPAVATGDNYLIHYSVEVRTLCPVSGSQSAGITLAIETNDDPAGAGVWIERTTVVYSVTAVAGAGGCGPQYGRPVSDIDAFSFGTYADIDEAVPNDTDYVSLFVDYAGGPYTDHGEVALSAVTDPGVHADHLVTVRLTAGVTLYGQVVVQLREGGVPRATWYIPGPLPIGSYGTYTNYLTLSEAAAITNYGNLSVIVELQADVGDNDRSVNCSWVEFSCPGGTNQQTVWSHEQKLITVAGLGLNDKVRLKVKTVTNPTLLAGFSVHGFDGVGDPAAGVTYSVGAPLAVQGFGVLKEEAFCCASGELYKLNYATAAWEKKVTAAQVNAITGGTFTTTAPVYFTPFVSANGTPVLVINSSEGTHKPFYWDGVQTGVTTDKFESIAGAEAAGWYGQPTVYYAKLFAIKYDARDTITWSEENQPKSGWGANGNLWTLSQTGGGTLYCLVGTNEALYYFRGNSIGSIRGAVDTDFTASGVHDNISTTVGTTAPRGAALIGSVIWVQDAEGRPWAFVPGGEIEPLWEQVADYFGRTMGDPYKASPGDRLIFPGAWVGLDAEHVVACCWAATSTQAGGILLFESRTRQALCVFTPPFGDDYSVVGPGYAQASIFSTTRKQPVLLVGYYDGSCVCWPPFYSTGSQYGLTSPTRVQSTPWVRVHAGHGVKFLYLWDTATVVGYTGEGDGAEVNVNVTPYWAATNDLTMPAASNTFKFFRTAGQTAGTTQALTQQSGSRRSRRLVWGLERESRHLFATFEGMPGLEQVTLEAGIMQADPARP